jgi:hypothetical protein
MWSEMNAYSKPLSSARRASATRSRGGQSSLAKAYPISAMDRAYRKLVPGKPASDCPFVESGTTIRSPWTLAACKAAATPPFVAVPENRKTPSPGPFSVGAPGIEPGTSRV